MRLIFWAAIIAFALDQASKWGVVYGLGLIDRGAIDVVPPLLNFRMGWNTGINFGLFSGAPDIMRWFLVSLAVVICLGLLIWIGNTPMNSIGHLSAGLLIGGALGNALDRVVYGAVADFLNMSCCGIQNPYTFNVADIFIFLGAIGLTFFSEPKKQT